MGEGGKSIREETQLFQKRITQYQNDFKKYGNSELTLAMPSDRRNIRYFELIKFFDFYIQHEYEREFSICDAGCGLGDLNKYLETIGYTHYSYLGLDIVPEFLEECAKNYSSSRYHFANRNFMIEDISDLSFDYAVSSQAFTIQYREENNNYDLIFRALENLFRQCKIGMSFNFFSDKVDFYKSGTAYHNPVKILEFVYSLSANVILDNSCLPYECTITVFKDTQALDHMVFDRFKRLHQKEFESGIFVIKEK